MATYAGRYSEDLQDRYGNGYRNALVAVQTLAAAPVTLYADRTKGAYTPAAGLAANEIKADSRGNLIFFADPGNYQIVVTPVGGSTLDAFPVSVLPDPLEPDASEGALAAEEAARIAADDALSTSVAGKVSKADNLSDLVDVEEARGNLGLGDAATQDAADLPVSDDQAAAIAAHGDRTDNPHLVTKAQVGLSSVDNTSDVNKPISDATQVALNLKASVVEIAPLMSFLGDSILDGSVSFPNPTPYGAGTALNGALSTKGPMCWTQLRLRSRIILAGSKTQAGTGLNTWLTTNLAALQTLLTMRFKWLLVHIGTNDLGVNGRTATQLIANFTTLISMCQAAGKEVILTTIMPRNAPFALTTQQEAWRNEVNTWLLAAPSKFRGVQTVDFAGPMTSGFDGLALASLFSDGLHPNTAGGEVMGRLLAEQLASQVVGSDNLPQNNADPTNLVANGLFTGNAAGLATPGWTLVGTPTKVVSKVARTDGPGEWQKVEVSTTGVLQVRSTVIAATPTVVGDRYVGEIAYRNATFSTLNQCKLQTIVGAQVSEHGTPVNVPLTAANFPASGVFRTPPIYAAAASSQTWLSFYVDGIGSIEITQARMRSIGQFVAA